MIFIPKSLYMHAKIGLAEPAKDPAFSYSVETFHGVVRTSNI